MSAAKSTMQDSVIAAQLLDAARRNLLSTDTVIEVLLEALHTGQSTIDLIQSEDWPADHPRRPLTHFLSRLLEEDHSPNDPTPETVDGADSDTAASPPSANASSLPSNESAAGFPDTQPVTSPESALRYEAQSVIGQGGWGIVSRARDLHLHRDVAVKKLIGDAADEEAEQRFEHEACITAQLQHPGIVPIYERGTDPSDGRPFYAMKLLEGVTLRSAIQDYHLESLPRRQRSQFHRILTIYIDVCRAVSYAHDQGIIHRDLKPANILIGPYGETVVVDWGIAQRVKPVDAAADEVAADVTLAAGTPDAAAGVNRSVHSARKPTTPQATVVGTPTFMSPEQARGDQAALDPRSDIYSLGAVLYLILTGKPPYHGDSPEEILGRVAEGIFDPPRRIKRRVPRALESICRKAMARSADDRYSTADELAEDISRYLTNESVTAHRDRPAEAAARFCRRYPAAASAGLLSAVLIAVTATIAGLSVAAARDSEKDARLVAEQARRQETDARLIAEKSRSAALQQLAGARRAADEWLIGLSGTLDRFPGMESTRRSLLERAQQHYQEILASGKQQDALFIESVRAQIRLADLQLLAGDPVAAETEFRDVHRKLVDVLQSEAEQPPAASADSLRIERLNAAIGLASCSLASETQPSDVSRLLQEELESVLPASTGNPDANNAVARSLLVLGRIDRRLGFNSEIDWFRRSVRRAIHCDEDSPGPRSEHLLQTARSELAEAYSSAGQLQEAARILQDQIDRLTSRLQQQPDRPDLMEDLAVARMQWGGIQRRCGNDWAAEQAYRSAVESLSESWQLMFGDHFYTENLAVAQANLGQLSLHLKRTTEAETALRMAVDQLTGLLRSEQGDQETARRLAACNVALGQVLLLTRNPAAEQQILRSLEIFAYFSEEGILAPSDQLSLARGQLNLGLWYSASDDLDQAAEYFLKTIASLQNVHSELAIPQAPLLEAEAHLQLASLIQLHSPERAHSHYQRAAQLLDSSAESEPRSEWGSRNSATARLLEAVGDYPLLNDRLDADINDLSDRLATLPARSARSYQLAAAWQFRRGSFRDAEDSIRRAITSRRFPDAVDQAIHGCIAAAVGQSETAGQCLAHCQTALTKIPGDQRLRRWTNELSALLKPDLSE